MTDNILVQCCKCKKYEVTGKKDIDERVFQDMPEAVKLVLEGYQVSHTYCKPCLKEEQNQFLDRK